MDPRVSQLAEVLVGHSLALEPGEKVLIEATDVPPEATAAVVRAVAGRGALPFVECRHTRVLREVYRHASEPQMALLGELELARMQKMDGFIALRGADNALELSDVPTDRLALHQRLVWRPVHGEQRCSHTRWVVLRWPTPSMAQSASMSTEQFEDFYYRACCLDYGRLHQAGLPLQERMARAEEIRVVGPGTDLVLRKPGIPAVLCSGDRNIPDGECFTAPLKDGVEGTITFNTASLYQGCLFENISFTLERGRIVRATASESARLNAILDLDEGARYVGEFSLGFHPHILEPMRDTLFDEKIAGSIHFTPGNAYTVADNGNRSQVHWDIVLIQRPEYGGGEIYFDGELIRKDGLFLPADLLELNPDRLGA